MYTTLIETEQLAESLLDPNTRILDCRFDVKNPPAGEVAWRQNHIPGARYVNLDTDMASVPHQESGRHPLPSVDAFKARLGTLGIESRSQVVVYDDAGGAIAGRMWWLLHWVGHEAVALLNGGMPKWIAENRPLSNKPPAKVHTDYPISVNRQLWLSTDEVMKAQQHDSLQLLDARGPDRFAGENETLDPRGGHIPGSLNLPFMENLNKDSTFKSVQFLRQRFEPLTHQPRAICHSCGSGVTACHNYLAMVHAGFDPGRLYVGSWSEWIQDSKRPIATGSK